MLSGDILSETLDYLDGPESLFTEIQNGLFNLSGPKWDNISFEAKRITSGLLSMDPAKRLRLPDLLESKWVIKLFLFYYDFFLGSRRLVCVSIPEHLDFIEDPSWIENHYSFFRNPLLLMNSRRRVN